MEGISVGTRFHAQESQLENRKRWIFGAPPADAETERKRARQKAILDQFLAADLVVIATPMWNFNAPPMLKAFAER